MDALIFGAGVIVGILVGFWARKYLGKKNPAALAAADAAVKDAGERARERF